MFIKRRVTEREIKPDRVSHDAFPVGKCVKSEFTVIPAHAAVTYPAKRQVGRGKMDQGIIDAIYLRDGVWTIVEFKTDSVRDRVDLEKRLAEQGYLAQAQRYVTAMERLLGQRPRSVLCMLNLDGAVYLHR